MAQAFFSLSLGMGAMLTYGSYLDREANLPLAGASVMLFDTGIALLAGLGSATAALLFAPLGLMVGAGLAGNLLQGPPPLTGKLAEIVDKIAAGSVEQALVETAFQGRGFSWQQEYHWKRIEDNVDPGTTELRGLYAQAGFFPWSLSRALPRPLELAARFAWVDPDNSRPENDRHAHERGHQSL